MSPFSSLPLELVHEIIRIAAEVRDDEYPDIRLLTPCSLVCKTFYRVTRELQFNELTLILDAKESRTVPEILTYQHKDLSLPPLARYVRELDLTFDITQHAVNEVYVDYLDAVLAPFSGDACRIRDFTFTAEKSRRETRIIFPNVLLWHEIPPPTQQKFANLLQSSSLDFVDIYGVVDLPLRLLQSMSPTVTCLSLAVTSVAVAPEDLTIPEQIPPPLLPIEELNIGELEFKLMPTPSSMLTETEEEMGDTTTSSIALHTGLSAFMDLSRLQILAVLQTPRDVHVRGPPPSLKDIFSLCPNLEGLDLQFVRCEDLYTLHLDKLPASVTWLDLNSFGTLPFASAPFGQPSTMARFSGVNDAALFPTNIGCSSPPRPQLPEVTVYLPLAIHQFQTLLIDTLVLADGTTPYWEALVQNLTTIPASTIYLEISVQFEARTVTFSAPEKRPDKYIEAELDHVLNAYNLNHPNKPIILRYCFLPGKR